MGLASKSYYARNRGLVLKKAKNRRDDPIAGPIIVARIKAWRAKNSSYDRERYIRDKEKFREQGHARYWSLKLEFIAAYGGKCTCCGESEPSFLTVEHKNRDGKEHRKRVGQGSEQVYRDLKRLGWPDFVTVFCYNCNLASRWDSVCPHQRRVYGNA